MRETLALVLAGGEGKRLYPLTRERSKPAVHFGGRYRLIDFVLSNLVNSGFTNVIPVLDNLFELEKYEADIKNRLTIGIRMLW